VILVIWQELVEKLLLLLVMKEFGRGSWMLSLGKVINRQKL
jgi:hypothetical protein